MKTKLRIDIYSPSTQYLQGRLIFKSKGTFTVVDVACYIDPLLNLIHKLNIKRIIWRSTITDKETGITIIPEQLLKYIKPEKLALMKQQRETNIVHTDTK